MNDLVKQTIAFQSDLSELEKLGVQVGDIRDLHNDYALSFASVQELMKQQGMTSNDGLRGKGFAAVRIFSKGILKFMI